MDRTSRFLVLLSGELAVTDRLRAQIAGRRAIAADGGMRHAAELGVTPELWVGDFDSTPADLDQAWSGVERLPYSQAKNETDGELAAGEAVSRGASDIVVAGALGGPRTDHGLFNLLMACRLQREGISVLVTSGTEEATPLMAGRQTFDLPPGSLFSILGFSELTGIGIEGARYPLDGYTLRFGTSRTISNVAEGPVTITLGAGIAVLITRSCDFSGA
ncbi:MAG TPA: thiamine diphosphokinase [Pararhizobium sp.]|nr:thiamine diphosphokinase [Pararhizobium sp.]